VLTEWRSAPDKGIPEDLPLPRRLRLIDNPAVDDRHVRLDVHDLILGHRQESAFSATVTLLSFHV